MVYQVMMTCNHFFSLLCENVNKPDLLEYQTIYTQLFFEIPI